MNKPVILCVDDESIVLISLKEQLKTFFKGKVSIETAESGEEALEILDELILNDIEAPLVISDQIMPGMHGDELLIKIHERLPRTNKVLLTGLAVKEDIVNVVNHANLYRYIPKPWDKTDLNLTAKEALNAFAQEKQISDKNAELKKANNELKRINEELDTFLYKASHDLKGPLATLEGLCNLGILERDIIFFKKQKSVLSDMYLLLDKIVKVGEMRNKILMPEKINVADFIREHLDLFKQEIAKQKVSVTVKVDKGITTFQDRLLLSTALSNMIHNAIIYTQNPSDTRENFINITAQIGKNECSIEVCNNGIGIPADVEEKVFYMFYTANDRNPGMGLGLYIARIALMNLGGTLELTSISPENTCFKITLPA